MKYKTLVKHKTNQYYNTVYYGYYNSPQKKQHTVTSNVQFKCYHSVCPTCQQMSLVYLGQQLLEAARTGQDDDVKALMANGAPFTTDWVRLIWVNYGIICKLIRNKMSVNAHLLPRKRDCQLLLPCWTLSPCSDSVTVMLRPHIARKRQEKVKETLSRHFISVQKRKNKLNCM